MQLYGLTKADREATRRTNRGFAAMGKGQAPNPKRRRAPGVSQAADQTVVLIESVDGATWDPETRKLTPVTVTAPVWFAHSDSDGTLTYDELKTITFKNRFTKSVDIAGGFGRIAVVSAEGWLDNVDCEEVQLPEED